MASENICYLCGTSILPTEGNVDHVPPRQFYATSQRKDFKLNLFTLPTHERCNKSFQRDEDYFAQSLFPAIEGTEHHPLWKDFQRRAPNRPGLTQAVFSEFSTEYRGIILPPSLAAKKFNPDRIWRVVWKLIRGLHFKETREVLPENAWHRHLSISVGRDDLHEMFEAIRNTPLKGDYPRVFSYKYQYFPRVHNAGIWGLLFWDGLMTVTVCEHPRCDCDKCNLRRKRFSTLRNL